MDKLMQSLINAKKVMNKVDKGDFGSGNIDKRVITSSPEELLESLPHNAPQIHHQQQGAPVGEYKERVSNSKLPDSIKKAMMENQIPQPELNYGSGISLEFAEEVAKKMSKVDELSNNKPKKQQQRQQIREDVDEFSGGNLRRTQSQSPQNNKNHTLNEMLIQEMKPLIKEIIQNTLEATVEKVLLEKFSKAEQIQKINEELQIKVGDSIFVGKIVGVKTKR